jgi:hypothetical protein
MAGAGAKNNEFQACQHQQLYPADHQQMGEAQ